VTATAGFTPFHSSSRIGNRGLALEQEIDPHGAVIPLLRRYLERHTNDAALAEELLEQTLLRMQFGYCRSDVDVLPWALSIARRLMLVVAMRDSAR
jgi:DNA-directed RNA polymerase specialized sigma24 family protein